MKVFSVGISGLLQEPWTWRGIFALLHCCSRTEVSRTAKLYSYVLREFPFSTLRLKISCAATDTDILQFPFRLTAETFRLCLLFYLLVCFEMPMISWLAWITCRLSLGRRYTYGKIASNQTRSLILKGLCALIFLSLNDGSQLCLDISSCYSFAFVLHFDQVFIEPFLLQYIDQIYFKTTATWAIIYFLK